MILVTGATGTIGSATVAALRAKGVDFKVGSRSPEKAKALGVPVVELDWERSETLAGAVAGVDKAFLLTPVTEQVEGLTSAFVEAAKKAGVGHVVKLSVISAGPDSIITLGRQHGAAEEAIRSSGLNWTMLQPTFFVQNFVNYYGADPGADSTVYLPHGQGKASWVDARDVGEVAAAALTAGGHEGKAYVLTGPEALGAAEVLAILGEALGRKYDYVDVPDEAARKAMTENKMPAWMIDAQMELHGLIKNGHAAGVSPAVKEVFGRDGRSVREYAKDVATGRK
jgi:uncharacterized protein YbjT (DUF2867 family)